MQQVKQPSGPISPVKDILSLTFCTHWHMKQHLGREGRSRCYSTSKVCQFQPPPQFPLSSPKQLATRVGFFTKMIDYSQWQPLPLGSTSMILRIQSNNHLAGNSKRKLQHFLLLWLILEKFTSACDLALAHRLYWGGRRRFLYMLLFEMCSFILGWVCIVRENLSVCISELNLRCLDNTGNLIEVLISVSKINKQVHKWRDCIIAEK